MDVHHSKGSGESEQLTLPDPSSAGAVIVDRNANLNVIALLYYARIAFGCQYSKHPFPGWNSIVDFSRFDLSLLFFLPTVSIAISFVLQVFDS